MSNDPLKELFNVSSHNPSFFSVVEKAGFDGEVVDFCIPVNLHFPPAEMVELIHENLREILRYYPDYSEVHARHIGAIADLPAENVVPCNGSTEIITTICRLAKGSILTSIPTFSRWTDLPEELNVPLHTITRRREHNFRLEVSEIVDRCRNVGARNLVISNPNNPTGAHLSLEEIDQLVNYLGDLETVIVDESFIDFSDLESAASLATKSSTLIVVKSLGKSLGWHGVRLGYAVANSGRAEKLRSQLPFWNINGLAAYILKNFARFKDEYYASFARVAQDRIYMSENLANVEKVKVFPSCANFLYVELQAGLSGKLLRDNLLKNHGIMIRECSNKRGSSENYLRLAVQKRAAVDRLIEALKIEVANMSCGHVVLSAA